ncbi:N-acetyltransferase [Phenylobacterium sp.]|jgi:putative acetyltransferase|uniref:GNAT family N-acetyltransferase n=1 Tax=Phenylobacterium sp. TaxID=1871053 RepID=UPI002E32AF55|nr:N-acetyltransferase [Phenylobacterium sp.]HEX2561301.1 N-acetyltransferase [Phenylobacterium sp.]
MHIRREAPEDAQAVDRLVAEAFGAEGESTADFVRRIRREAEVCLALVAVEAGEIVGQAQFGAVPIRTPHGPRRGAYFACLSVAPRLHGRGIGSALVQASVAQLREIEVEVVMVLGSPRYYPRFGFSSELAGRIRAPYSRMGKAFQAIELADGALALGGDADFHPALVSMPEPDAG